MARTVAGLALFSIVAAAAWLGAAGVGAPDPRPASAPAEEFSAERALAHVEAIATAPRPIGSEAHAAARAYVVRQVEALGLEATVQSGVGRSPWVRNPTFGSVQNVVVRLPGADGEASGPAVLLAAHYDSVPSGPGASDDAVGVAVLLETLRALRAGPPLGHDVIALFTDGEEAGLLGADSFNREHPWIDDVAVVLNFEARGTRGPAVMFETGPHNLWLIRRFAAASPHPVAASYSYEVYRRLPNDTDFSVFRDRGLNGLNFGHIHGAVGYHTAKDSVARLAPGSLQHHGDNALALARELAGSDLEAARAARGDAVYFNPWGSSFVWFPASWVSPLVVLVALGVLWVVALAVRRRRPAMGGLLAGVVFWVLAVAVVGGLGALARGLVFPVPYDFRIWGDASSFGFGLFAWTLIALGLACALYFAGRRWLSAPSLAAGGVVLWLVIAVVASLAAPGTSYLFLVPLAIQTVALGWTLGRPVAATEAATDPIAPVGFLLLAAAAAVTALVWGPTLALAGVGLQVGAMVPLSALAALLLAFLAPQLELVTAVRPRALVPATLVLAGLALAVAVRAASTFGAESPRPTSLLYALDADEGRALWGSTDRRSSPWTESVLPPEPERRALPQFVGHERELATGPAPVLDLEHPAVRVAEAPESGEPGTYRLRVMPPPDAARLRVRLEPAASILSLSVQGLEAELPDDRDAVSFAYVAPPGEGIEVVLELGAGPAPEVGVVAQWYRLPSVAEGGPPARDATMMPSAYGWDGDSTMVRATFPLEAAPVTADVAAPAVSPGSDIR